MTAKVLDFNQLLANLKLAINQPSSELIQHLAYTKKFARPYDGTWHAPWLLVDWTAKIWKTTAGAKTRQDCNGNWVSTYNVKWDILLTDNLKLTDDRYATLLETCRRVIFLYRQGIINKNPPSVSSCRNFTNQLISLCQWLVLEQSRYHPSKYGLKLLDQAGIKRLMSAVARGGWSEALAINQRCLSGLYQTVYKQPCPSALLDSTALWPVEIRDEVIHWLKTNAGYSQDEGKLADSGLVSRKLLGKLASIPQETLIKNVRLSAVMRQFEPKLAHPSLLISPHCDNEYPSQSTPLLQSVLHKSTNQQGSVKDTSKMLSNLLMLYRHIPEQLPHPEGINIHEAKMSSMKLTTSSGHTPFIPVDTAFKYLNYALRWVVCYGDALVEYYLTVMQQMQIVVSGIAPNNAWGRANNRYLPHILARTPLPVALLDAGFQFTRLATIRGTERSFERLRNEPTLHEALEIYIGAVTVVITLLKPSRDTEITNLPRICLLKSRQGHYWLDSDLAKRTRAERRARTGGKPIPVITARAIQQVRKLNRGLVDIFGEDDPHKVRKLFYLPNPNHWGTGKAIDNQSLNTYLDKFCDYISLPPDEHGRRWYLRIHQMRKWFLLLLFWSGRYDVLDAARWIAGHTDIKHLYAYIEREFPGGKIGKMEAECAIDRLAEYDTTRVTMDGDDISLVELHQRILRHFRVESLNMVSENDWHLLIEELFEDEYHLEPYTITADNGDKRLCIAIRVGQRDGDA